MYPPNNRLLWRRQGRVQLCDSPCATPASATVRHGVGGDAVERNVEEVPNEDGVVVGGRNDLEFVKLKAEYATRVFLIDK